MHQALDDIDRIKSLLSYGILDTPEEESFNELAKLVAHICETPMAFISFIDADRQWYKAKVGSSQSEVPIEETICQHVINSNDLLYIPNTLDDSRVKNNPHVVPDDGVRFYLGVPLKSDDGFAIGTVCAVDMIPKQLSHEKQQALVIIAKQVMFLVEAVRTNNKLREELSHILDQKVTEARQEAKLREKNYNDLLMAISKSNGVVEFSPEGNILSVNKNFEEIVGYSEKELIGKKHNTLLYTKDRKVYNEFWEALRKGEFKSGRYKRKHKDGSAVWIQASYSPVLDSKNEVVRITKIAQNVTTEIKSREALENAKHLADELNIQKDHFIANVSHEIRTPINAIIGFTELLLEKESSKEKSKQLRSIKVAGDNLLYLVNDILDISKIESGIFQIDRLVFSPQQIVADVFSMLQNKATLKKLKFSYDISKKVPQQIWGDNNRLAQILINLLGNAIKFTNKGSVHLSVDVKNSRGNNGTLIFNIKDTGIGIPKDKMKTIFERFSQAEESTTRQYGGTGLGLNIVKQLVQKQNGIISVKSKLTKGSEFSFTLPFESVVGKKGTKRTKPLHAKIKKRKGRILMCEDNELNQNLAAAVFANSGYQLDIVSNGKEGLSLIRKNKYDLILMDIQMPEMDGYDTIVAIRQKLKLTTPVIALTAHSIIKEKQKCLELGMNDYVAKPYRKDDLFERIESCLNNTSLSVAPNVKWDLKKQLVSFDQLEELSGGDEPFQREMLQMFLAQSSEMIDKVVSAFKKKDSEEVLKLLHKLKGSYGMLNADSGLINKLETIVKRSKKMDEVPAGLVSLKANHKKIQSEVNKKIKTFA